MNTQAKITKNEQPPPLYSKEYEIFRKETLRPALSLYEQLCHAFERLNIRIIQKEPELQESIRIAHLQITPQGVTSLAIGLPFLAMLIGVVFSALILNSIFFVLFSILGAAAFMAILLRVPGYTANSWRMRASNQMVLCIFYVVTYMRHTSNIERAIEFASTYLAPPLALDLKKVLWDVEIERYTTVKESLDVYLETWRKHNAEFVESFHLIESSLYESSEERRSTVLDKSLQVILEGTKEKMLHYAQNLKSPITTLHMLGVVLPILGLVILPLIVSFMEEVKWWHIGAVYNITLPLLVYYLSKNILSTRPTGYGDADIAETNPEFKKYQNIIIKLGTKEFSIQPLGICFFLGITCLILALAPVLLYWIDPLFDIPLLFNLKLLDYRPSIKYADVIVGPYGLGAAVLSLFLPLALTLSIGLYYRLVSRNIITIREKTKQLENEFASALFQLGNRLGDGLPVEIAFPKVAKATQGTVTGKFFEVVSTKLALGLGIEEAIAEAARMFPSNIIRSSMKVLVESVKRGPLIAAQALMNISKYISEIHIVNERLKDLLADIMSDVRSQISFLTPTIAGVVVGITSMITYFLSTLSSNITALGQTDVAGNISNIASMFGDGIPTYYFQIVIGTYVFEIIFILSVMANGIENGADKLSERYLLGKNTVRSTLLYIGIALTVMVLFTIIASRMVVVTGVLGR